MKRNLNFIYAALLFSFYILFVPGCKKETSTIPTISTINIIKITNRTATSGGNIIDNGGSEITACGVCWNISTNPTIKNNLTSDSVVKESFISRLVNLTPNTTYFLRSYATNSSGTAYGNEISFKTIANLPIITTTSVSDITKKSATSGGTIIDNGDTEIIACGVCWNRSTNPTTQNNSTYDNVGKESFISRLENLTPSTTYFLRSYATNSSGTAYGNEISFKTTADLPSITTTIISDITEKSATSGGTIIDDGGAEITASGVCWSLTPNPTILDNLTQENAGTGYYTSKIVNLKFLSTYYVKAYATNSAGTVYGNELSFSTTGSLPSPINITNAITFNPNLTYGSVTDIDGNIYKTITIGQYTWIAENLRVTRFQNGDPIPYITKNEDWASSRDCYCVGEVLGMCDYGNEHNIDSIAKYGLLYSTLAINDPRKMAPVGWHVATSIEWDGIIYNKTLTHRGADWYPSSEIYNSTFNTSGLTLLPAGIRHNSGTFIDRGESFWGYQYNHLLTVYSTTFFECCWEQIWNHGYAKFYGYPVRCVKDY